MSGEADDILVRRVVDGETSCFRALIERYQDAVFGIALSKTGSHADAQDIAQDVFLTAYKELAKLKDPTRFGPWLHRIAQNAARMHLRSAGARSRAERHRAAQTETTSAAPDPADRWEMEQGVMAALASLSEPNREAATLFYINGYSQQDIANFTSRPLGTIKRRLHDARRQLRKELIDMVEDNLKRTRPGPQFTQKVLRDITKVRVDLEADAGRLGLTDSKGLTFVVRIGLAEARAIRPWLAGEGDAQSLDMHTALVRCLRTMDRRIEDANITQLEMSTFYALLKVRFGRRTARIDCRPSDAVNFAVRAEAPILVDKKIVDEYHLTDADGKPLPPDAPTDRPSGPHRVLYDPLFKDFEEVFRALEDDPDICRARHALFAAAPGFGIKPAPVLDTAKGMEKLQSWVRRCRRSKHAALAESLLGAVLLWPAEDAERAIPHLERAHKLAPKDDRITFDLATAYARMGRADEVFAIFRKHGLTVFGRDGRHIARHCGNFAGLWDDPRFESIIGKPDRRWRDIGFIQAIVATPKWGELPRPDTKRRMSQWHDALALERRPSDLAMPGGYRTPQPDETGPIMIKGVGQRSRRHLQSLLGFDVLLPVQRLSRTGATTKTRHRLSLHINSGTVAVIRVKEADRRPIDVAFEKFPSSRPQTAPTICSILRETGIGIEAIALLRRGRSGVHAALVLKDDEQEAVVQVAGIDAVAVGCAAGCPIVITETLARKLTPRNG